MILTNQLTKFFMKKTLILSILFAVSILTIQAQKGNSTSNASTYKSAIGVKFYPGAITFKHFFTEKAAGELLGYFRSYGTRITALYEIHGNINNAGGLKYYFGPGGHVSFISSKYGGGGSVGVDGVLGLDYKINSAPINLSLDWQPSFDFKDTDGFIGDWFGIAIRYTF